MPAYFRCSLPYLSSYSNDEILGKLATGYDLDGFTDLKTDAIASWNVELPILRAAIEKILQTSTTCSLWELLLEYPIPRLGKRIDAILLCGNIIVVIEFKSSSSAVSAAVRQVEDYSLDLRDFHKESWCRRIIPIVLAPGLNAEEQLLLSENQISPTIKVDESGLAKILAQLTSADISNDKIDPERWDQCLYTPTPTIVEAAQHLYNKNSVDEIMKASAGTDAINNTTNAVLEIIETAKAQREKIICFVTGVPGSGKTLVGLNIANRDAQDPARFMSGNIPLIIVLQEALARDLHKQGTPATEARRLMRDRIQNIHIYTKDHFNDSEARPPEDGNIIIYDEAQRAWDRAKNWASNKIGFSEPEMILEVMGRLDWCALIAIIGNGQEINTGEAGLEGWRDALEKHRDWQIYIPDASHSLDLFSADRKLSVTTHNNLHLDACMRSYTAQTLSDWIDCVLDGRDCEAQDLSKGLSRFPIVLTRNLQTAKAWLKHQSFVDSTETTARVGLVASSGAKRLRAHGIDVSTKIEESNWFLNHASDIRSSSFLELVSTEYAAQGLELDYVGLCWGADFRHTGEQWSYHALSGTKWTDKNKDTDSQIKSRFFTTNTYRVLLSRAREGIVIWVPPGEISDSTRHPDFYDCTANYLMNCGALLLD